MDKELNLKDFLIMLKNGTNDLDKGVVLKHDGKPVAVLMSYEQYLELIKFWFEFNRDSR